VNCSSPVKSGLSIEREVHRFQSGPGGQPNEIDVPVERRMRRNITLKPEYVCAKTEMRQAARISLSGLTPVRAVPACRPSQTSEFIVSDADISRGRLLTLSWLLLEESKFLLHI